MKRDLGQLAFHQFDYNERLLRSWLTLTENELIQLNCNLPVSANVFFFAIDEFVVENRSPGRKR